MFLFLLHRLEFSRTFLPADLTVHQKAVADDCILCADARRYAHALFRGNYLGLRTNRHPLGVILTGAVAEPLARAGVPRPFAVSVTLAFWPALAIGALFVFLRRQGVQLVAAAAAPAAAMMAFGTVTTLSVVDNYGTALFGSAAFLLAAGESARHAARHPPLAGLVAGALAGLLAGWGHLPNIVLVFFYTALAWPRLQADVPNRVMWSLLIPSAVAAALAFAPTVVIGAVSSGEFLGEASRLLDRYASITHFFEPRLIIGYATSFFVFAWTAPLDAVQCRFAPEAVMSILDSLPKMASATLGVGLTVAALSAGRASAARGGSEAHALAWALGGVLAISFLFYLYFNPEEVLLYSSQWTMAVVIAAALIFKGRSWLPFVLIASAGLGLVVNVPPLYNPASFDTAVCCPLSSY